MNVPLNLAKSSLLALVIFWTIICSEEGIDSDMILLILISLIPIFIVVTAVVIGTICSIYWITMKEGINEKMIFKTYFPYYAIIAFLICVYGIIVSNFENYFIAFFTSAFLTSCQSWVWFANEEKPKHEAT